MTSHFSIYLHYMNAPVSRSLSLYYFLQQSTYHAHRSGNHLFETYHFAYTSLFLSFFSYIQLLYSSNCMFSAKSLLFTQLAQFFPVSFYWCLHMLFNYGAMDVHATRLWFKRHIATHFQVCVLVANWQRYCYTAFNIFSQWYRKLHYNRYVALFRFFFCDFAHFFLPLNDDDDDVFEVTLFPKFNILYSTKM